MHIKLIIIETEWWSVDKVLQFFEDIKADCFKQGQISKRINVLSNRLQKTSAQTSYVKFKGCPFGDGLHHRLPVNNISETLSISEIRTEL